MKADANGSFPFELACPRCRKPGADGKLTVSVLVPVAEATGKGSAHRCQACRTSYPHIDGVPCVPPDLESFQQAQAWALAGNWIHRERNGAEAACRLAAQLDCQSNGFIEVANLAQYALGHYPGDTGSLFPELEGNRFLLEIVHNWLAGHSRPAATGLRLALEAGCGPGAAMRVVAPLFPDGVLGLDLRIAVLRLARHLALHGEAFLPFRVEGNRFEPIRIVSPRSESDSGVWFLQGDIFDPPLQAEVFPAVVALSLLDSVADPLFVLGQLDALLAPGGLMLLGTPYSWDSRVTPPQAWWSHPDATGGGMLRAALSGRLPALPHLRYELLEELDRVPWAIPGHARLVHRYFLDLVLARKA